MNGLPTKGNHGYIKEALFIDAGKAGLYTKTGPLQLTHSNRQWMRAKDALTRDLARAYNMTMVPRRCIQAELTLLGTHSSLLTG